MIGIIGGSGFEKFDEFELVEELSADTPFGPASSGLKRVRVDGVEALFVSRHGAHHELLPSEVNYAANVYALKYHGAKAIISFSAIGSLQAEMKPGDMVVPNQYVDRTKGFRRRSFCGEGIVGHVSLAEPVCMDLVSEVKAIAQSQSLSAHFKATYVCIEGPYFSTKAEAKMHRQMGFDVIGMTNFPEYGLAREAGLPYVPCCFVTDFDCWDDSIPHVTVQEVIEIMRQNNSKAFGVLKSFLKLDQVWEKSKVQDQGLKTGLFMPMEAVPADKRDWLEVLRS